MFGASPIRQTTPFLPVSDRQKAPIGFADGEAHFEVAKGDGEGKCFAFWKLKRRFAIRCGTGRSPPLRRDFGTGIDFDHMTR